MRIFYASDSTPNAFIASNIWRANLHDSLVGLGHEVLEFNYDLGSTFRHLDTQNPEHAAFIAENRPKVSAALLAQIKAAHAKKPLDMLFTYFYDACVQPDTIEAIKAMGIKTVNWYCNGSYQLHLVKEISPHYDWCLVPEKFRIKDYLAMGARPIYCQEAANPELYKPYDEKVIYDVSFVGQAYGERPEYIRAIHDAGIKVHVFGPRWDKHIESSGLNTAFKKLKHAVSLGGPVRKLPKSIVGGVLSDEELIRTYSRSKINLGFSSVGDTHKTERIVQVRLRDFEVPMSGGFYMVEHMDELEEFFEIGREIVCYNGKDDMVEKIRYYLAHEGEREAIRKAGYERCKRDHTWQKRFHKAFVEMGLE